MENFIEKWNNDPRFKTKIKLSLYTLFVILVAIFAVSNRNNIPTNEIPTEENNPINEEENHSETITIPNEYDYTINITINESNYQYTGIKDKTKKTITKTVNGIDTNYIYEENYYKEDIDGNYLLTTKEEVYDIVDYNYLDLNTINQYLQKSTKIDNQYLVYLKDIILGNDSQDYITITKETNKIILDYTTLFSYFDKNIYRYLIVIKIVE